MPPLAGERYTFVPDTPCTIRTYNPYDRTSGNDTAVIPLDASPALPCRPYRNAVLWAATPPAGAAP
ncbi:hypothetical protein ACFRQM_45220, partial [Streptomyces sp. NPDC056831]